MVTMMMMMMMMMISESLSTNFVVVFSQRKDSASTRFERTQSYQCLDVDGFVLV